MRDFKGMKRQRGRNRGGGGGGGGGGKPQQNANRAFDSNGPDNIKVRGHAQHVFEKYQQLARDATSSGDRVLAENFLQHAEHYFRVLRTLQPNRPVSDFIARETFASGYDIDFEDESGAQALPDEPQPEGGEGQGEGGEQRADGQQQPRENRDGRQDRWENRGDRPRDDRPREDRARDDRPREDRQQRDGQQPREGRDRDRNRYDRDRPREDRAPRAEGEEGGERQYRDRDDRAPRQDREERAPRRERSYEPRGERADPLAVVEPTAAPLTSEEPASVLRSSDGETSHAPAFLQAAPAPAASDEEAPAKRPRGRPRKAAQTEEA